MINPVIVDSNTIEPGYSQKAVKIFLAGTIDNGESDNWQIRLANNLSKYLQARFPGSMRDVIFYNPRKSSWNPNASTEELQKQIKWELEHLDKSNFIVMNILGSSKSPISLMEIGLYADSEKLFVICPPEYYRFENVNQVCLKYGIPRYDSEKEFMKDLDNKFKE